MLEADKQEISRDLKRGYDALHDALIGVDEHLALRKPSPTGWSILE